MGLWKRGFSLIELRYGFESGPGDGEVRDRHASHTQEFVARGEDKEGTKVMGGSLPVRRPSDVSR